MANWVAMEVIQNQFKRLPETGVVFAWPREHDIVKQEHPFKDIDDSGIDRGIRNGDYMESILPLPSQTTQYSWEFSRSVKNDTIWVSKFDDILLDLWKPVVRCKFSYLVTTAGCCKFQFSSEFSGALIRVQWGALGAVGETKNGHTFCSVRFWLAGIRGRQCFT